MAVCLCTETLGLPRHYFVPCTLLIFTLRVSSSLTLPSPESIIIFTVCLLSIEVKGSLEIPGTCSGEAICNPAIAALAKLALPHDKVDPVAHRLLFLPLSHIQLGYVSIYSAV